jgi:hypothetical protein
MAVMPLVENWKVYLKQSISMDKTEQTPAVQPVETRQSDVEQASPSRLADLTAFYSHPWTQIILISLICFCCPGVSSI